MTIRPEVGEVAEWVEDKRDIKRLLAMRWAVDNGRYEDDLSDVVCPPETAERIRSKCWR